MAGEVTVLNSLIYAQKEHKMRRAMLFPLPFCFF